MAQCKCGCGEIITEKPWHKYRQINFVSGHNSRSKHELSLLDNVKDRRKGQSGLLSVKKINNIKGDALKAGHKWELNPTDAFLLITGDCSYCGEKPNWPITRNGIDRINSSIGYTNKNCQSCCISCNRGKSNMKETDFLEWVKRTYDNLVATKRISP